MLVYFVLFYSILLVCLLVGHAGCCRLSMRCTTQLDMLIVAAFSCTRPHRLTGCLLQAFHALYHTDENVLLGAPTGSGKTISAELAMLRVFNHYPGQKIIYIAPLKVCTGPIHCAGCNQKNIRQVCAVRRHGRSLCTQKQPEKQLCNATVFSLLPASCLPRSSHAKQVQNSCEHLQKAC